MIEVLLTVVPSLCWLVLRCYRLFQTPAEKLVRQLNVDIPHSPIICVDSLGNTHVELHWDTTICPDESIFYVVMVNGKDVGTLAHTAVKLSNLATDSLYSIQVLAVNAVSSFISQSPAVYVHTSAGGNSSMGNIKTGTKVELEGEAHQSALAAAKRLRGVSAAEISSMDIALVTCNHQLMEYLYCMQQELAKTTADHETLTLAHNAEERRLKAEIEKYRKEVSEITDCRQKRDQDLKELEKQKDSLTFTKLKLSKQIKALENTRAMHLNKRSELCSRVAKARERKEQALNVAEFEKEKAFHRMESLNIEIGDVKAAAAEAESATKALFAQKKALLTLTTRVRALIGQIRSPPSQLPPVSGETSLAGAGDSFTLDGELTALGAGMMHNLYALNPEWQADISRELDVLQGLDVAWRLAFCENITLYVSFYNNVEVARYHENHLYQPKKITEHQAALHFGGYSAASPKPAIAALSFVYNKKTKAQVLHKPGALSPSPLLQNTQNIQNVQNVQNIVPSETQLQGLNGSQEAAGVFAPGVTTGDFTSGEFTPEFTPEYTPDFTPGLVNSTPQLLNALMVALHPVSGPGTRVSLNNGGGFNYSLHTTSSPHLSFLEQEPQPANGSSSWPNLQTYPALSQNVYASLNVYPTHSRTLSMPYVKGCQIYATGSKFPLPLPLPPSAPQPVLSHDCPQNPQNMSQSMTHDFPQSTQNMTQFVSLNTSLPHDLSPHISHNLQSNILPTLQLNLQSWDQVVLPNVQQNAQQSIKQLGDYHLEKLIFATDVQQPAPTSSIQQYTQNLGQNLPYGESFFQRTPIQEQSYLTPQVQPLDTAGIANSFWNKATLSSLLDKCLPQITSNLLQASAPHLSNLSTDGGLLNSIILPGASHFSSANIIWLDKYIGGSYSHNRSVSTGSQLWGNDTSRREKSPKNPLVSEFLPFSRNTLPSQNGNSDSEDQTEYDIRLM